VNLIAGIVKVSLIVVSGSVGGVLMGIFPCYVFPLFGANARNWCGYKSEPPYFVELFLAGFIVTVAVTAYFLYFRKSRPTP
jgi:hypothetical protein